MGSNWCHTWGITGGLPVSCIRQQNTVNERAHRLLPFTVRIIVVGAGEAVQPRGLGVGNCDCGAGHFCGDCDKQGFSE
jgi:hypothetical protein